MSQGPNWEGLLSQVIGAAQQAGQPGLIPRAAGSAPAGEERALTALPGIIAALCGQGVAEEELFAAVVGAREVAGAG